MQSGQRNVSTSCQLFIIWCISHGMNFHSRRSSHPQNNCEENYSNITKIIGWAYLFFSLFFFLNFIYIASGKMYLVLGSMGKIFTSGFLKECINYTKMLSSIINTLLVLSRLLLLFSTLNAHIYGYLVYVSVIYRRPVDKSCGILYLNIQYWTSWGWAFVDVTMEEVWVCILMHLEIKSDGVDIVVEFSHCNAPWPMFL